MKEKIYCWLTKADRLAGWILLVIILLFVISGYGLTKGLIDRQLASALHLFWLMPIGFLAFIAHVGWAIHLALKRWKLWNLAGKIILALTGLILAIGFIYANYFYTPYDQQSLDSRNLSETNQESEPKTANSVSDDTAVSPTFTPEQLTRYDGKNGNPAYVAIDGKVYDASPVFRNGLHNGNSAGQDLSKQFNGRHPKQFLNRLKVVGVYAE